MEDNLPLNELKPDVLYKLCSLYKCQGCYRGQYQPCESDWIFRLILLIRDKVLWIKEKLR